VLKATGRTGTARGDFLEKELPMANCVPPLRARQSKMSFCDMNLMECEQ
jgi:hypothetical protein